MKGFSIIMRARRGRVKMVVFVQNVMNLQRMAMLSI